MVFKHGEGAMQVLPSLVDVIPEARLNLVIYHLKNDEVEEAFQLMQNLEPTTPQVWTDMNIFYEWKLLLIQYAPA